MRRLLLVASVLSLVPCCTWSDLDVEFLAALPNRADLKVAPPTQGGQALTSDGTGQRQDALASDQFLGLQQNAEKINALVDGLTGALDLVRKFPPSKREPDRRVWGPYEDQERPGFELEVEITRSPGEAVEYGYKVQWRRQRTQDPYVDVLSGGFKGEKAAEGKGEFVLDLDKGRSLGWAMGPDVAQVAKVTLTYSHAAGTDVKLVSSGIPPAKDASFHHLRQADGSGKMSYATESGAWTFEANANWLASRAGRVDAVARNKWWPLKGRYTECWDAGLTRVYWTQDYADDKCANDDGCTEGSAAACETAASTAW